MADQDPKTNSNEPKLISSPDVAVESSSSAEPQPSSLSSAAAQEPKKCHHCKSSESDSKPLKPCSKCQSTYYCSRDCQKAGWKVHKKTCAKDAQIYAEKADLKPAPPPRVPKKEGYRGGLQKWQFDT